MTLQQYVTGCLDESIRRASQVTSLRSKFKCIILKYAKVVLSAMSATPAHSNLVLARSITQRALSVIIDEATVDSLPLYASFYVQEIVNFACASITFTIDDKPLRSIQLPSANLLSSICMQVGITDLKKHQPTHYMSYDYVHI
jgi:hypothetical protein